MNFNSIKVRLKHSIFIQALLNRNFNSIKVRLKHNDPNSLKSTSTFQFHKGTIKTYFLTCYSAQPLEFQFHKGTIKTIVILIIILSNQKNFNSIKVRLKPGICHHVSNFNLYFNSIKVRLKRPTFSSDEFCVLDFNSIKVRLKHSNLAGENSAVLFQFHKGTIKTFYGFASTRI